MKSLSKRICGELYGSPDPVLARVCRRPAVYRIVVPGLPGAMQLCGIHARWYRKPGNHVAVA